jgi:hypothetical protein
VIIAGADLIALEMIDGRGYGHDGRSTFDIPRDGG